MEKNSIILWNYSLTRLMKKYISILLLLFGKVFFYVVSMITAKELNTTVFTERNMIRKVQVRCLVWVSCFQLKFLLYTSKILILHLMQ